MSIKIDIKAHNMKQVRRFMNGFTDDIRRVNERSAKRVGLKGEREAVLHLTNQDLNWTPNNSTYSDWKLKKGHSDKVLVKTSTYMQSITSFADGGRVWVGVSKDAKSEDGEEMTSIAAVLEFGSLKRGIPARPLWSVVLRELADWVKRENYFHREIINELKKKYGSAAGDVTTIIAPTTTINAQAPVQTGKRGGRYTVSSSGRKVYQKRS